jgi:predicted DNA-binding transcriptional regulator YafY
MLALLQTHRDWRGADLADRLGVTPRTVRRDVERLRELGYPVHATTGTAGGYRLGAGAALPPLLLDDEEAVAVAVGLRTATGGAVAGIEETSLRALAKLEQVLPDRLRRRVNAVQTYTVAVPRTAGGPTIAAELLLTLTAACRDREQVRFDYRSHGGELSRRAVEPHRLVSWGRRWYLVAWDTVRQDWRTFRVDRIQIRTPNGPRFAARELPDPDIARYVSRRVSSSAWRYEARIIVHAPAAEIIKRIDPGAGAVESMGEHRCLLKTGADSLETLAIYVSLLGIDFEIDQPDELRAHVQALAERYRRAAAGPHS